MTRLLLLVFVVGCAASPLKQHATAADVSADAISAAGAQITAAWQHAEFEAVDSAPTQDAAREQVGKVRAQYAPVSEAYETVRLAHQAYVAAIVRANARDTEVPAEIAANLAGAWRELGARGKAVALTFKDLPKPGGKP